MVPSSRHQLKELKQKLDMSLEAHYLTCRLECVRPSSGFYESGKHRYVCTGLRVRKTDNGIPEKKSYLVRSSRDSGFFLSLTTSPSHNKKKEQTRSVSSLILNIDLHKDTSFKFIEIRFCFCFTPVGDVQ